MLNAEGEVAAAVAAELKVKVSLQSFFAKR